MLKTMARKKTHSGKLNVRLPRRLNAAFRSWIEANADDYKYFRRRMGVEPCVGALVDFFMNAMDDEQRRALVSAWLPHLERSEAEELGVFIEAGVINGQEGDPVESATEMMFNVLGWTAKRQLREANEIMEQLRQDIRDLEETAEWNRRNREAAMEAEGKPAPAPKGEDSPGEPGSGDGEAKPARKRAAKVDASPKEGFFVAKRAPRKQRKDVDVAGPGSDVPKGKGSDAGKK